MNILIVEDEYLISQRLERFIKCVCDENQWECTIAKALSLSEADVQLINNPIDTIFLDLNLQNLDGFELLKDRQNKPFKCVVVSASSERAIEAFEHDVIDFVAKPFKQERIGKALHKLRESLNLPCNDYLIVEVGNQKRKIYIDEISYLKACGHYSEIYATDGQILLYEKGLNSLGDKLARYFIRVHKSFAVPLKQINKLVSEEGSKYKLQLKNNITIPASRAKVSEIRKHLE